MTSPFRPILVLAVMPLFCTSAFAQPSQLLPTEEMLNRYNLTLSWWGQAVVDRRRDKVQFLTADEQNVYVQANSSVITTFGGESGRRLWSLLLGAPDRVGFPASSNDEQLLISVGMQVHALDKMTGRELWQMRPVNHPSASPSVDHEQIYIGTVDGSVYTYDLRKVHDLARERRLPRWIQRARLWNFKSPREIVSPPIASGMTLTFASQEGIVYGVNRKNKRLKFQFESDGQIKTPIGYSKEVILVADTNARMYCLDVETGRIRWIFSSSSPIRQEPQVIGRQVFAIPHREGMVALSLANGQQLWEQPRVTEFLAASDTRVYASDLAGNVLILNRENGSIIGTLPLRHFSHRVRNDRTDRVFLSTESGTVIALRERDSEYPVFHLYPERRPILPEFGPEDGEETDAPDDDDAENGVTNQ